MIDLDPPMDKILALHEALRLDGMEEAAKLLEALPTGRGNYRDIDTYVAVIRAEIKRRETVEHMGKKIPVGKRTPVFVQDECSGNCKWGSSRTLQQDSYATGRKMVSAYFSSEKIIVVEITDGYLTWRGELQPPKGFNR